MDEAYARFTKASKAVLMAAKAVEAAAKAIERRNLAAVTELATKAVTALNGLAGLEAVAAEVASSLAREADLAQEELERERALFAGAVAKALNSQGLEVSGNLPRLYAGAFTLDFSFGRKGVCTIWFGPKKERLATAPLDPEAIVSRVLELDKTLFGRELDDIAFLSELERAYRVALLRRGSADGKVPLTALMVEVAFGRQGPAFCSDPRRELFSSYGRVAFAADLARLRTRRLGDLELRLEVATLAQTRRPEDHIFVPHGKSVDGTNYATAGFFPWRAP